MRRSRAPRYASLTSLLDVLFILVFASLSQAAAVGEDRRPQAAPAPAEDQESPAPDRALEPSPPAPEPPPRLPAEPPADLASEPESGTPPERDLYDRAVAMAAAGIRQKHPIYVRVSREGDVTELEEAAEKRHLELSVRLVERVPDPDVKLAYLGDRAKSMRVCALVRHYLGRDDLANDLVIVVPEVPLEDLPVAVVRGLRRDQERCLRDQLGLAILVQPGPAAKDKDKDQTD